MNYLPKSTTVKRANAALAAKSHRLADAVTAIKKYEPPSQFADVLLRSSKGHIIKGYSGEYPDGSVVITFHHVDGRRGSWRFATEWNPRGPLEVDLFLADLKKFVFKSDA